MPVLPKAGRVSYPAEQRAECRHRREESERSVVAALADRGVSRVVVVELEY